MLGSLRNASETNSLSRTADLARFGRVLTVCALAAALGACSLLPHRWRPGSETGAEVKNPPGGDQAYPYLGEVPDKAKPTETADMRSEIAKGLVADRDTARYTDQALRGGTESSAAPPPPPVAGELPALPTEATGAVGSAGTKLAENKTESDRKPGFFSRLFGKKEEEKVVDPNKPAPLPAQPVGQVDVKQVPAATQSN